MVLGSSPVAVINGFDSKLENVRVFTQGFILGLLLFLIYMNDLMCAIRYCSVHPFVDDRKIKSSKLQKFSKKNEWTS